MATAATGLAAYSLGGWTSRTVFIMTGLITVILLILINSQSEERARNQRELAQLHRELKRQHEFLRELSPLDSLDACVDHIVRITASRLRAGRVSIMLPDEKCEYLCIAGACGLSPDIIEHTRIPVGECVSGKVFNSDEPIHVQDAQAEMGTEPLPIASSAFLSGPLLLSGMRWGTARLGVLSVTEPIGRDDFSTDDELVFAFICSASAVVIHNHQVVEVIRKGNLDFLETLARAIEARDKYTRGHSERVCAYAMEIGRRLALGPQSLADLQTASRLHDIGKLGVPDAVLQKPGSLDEDEWTVIRRHPDIGARMLSSSPISPTAMEAIRYHHERLDGSGYHGLTRREIPLLARIIAVADAFDAMTSERPYHAALPIAKAVANLEQDKGRLLDAACVECFVEAVWGGALDSVIAEAAVSRQPAGTAS